MKTLLLVVFALAFAAGQPPKGSEFVGLGFDLGRGYLRPNSLAEVTNTFSKGSIYYIDFPEDVDKRALPAIELKIKIERATTVQEYVRNATTDIKIGASFSSIAFDGSLTVQDWVKNKSVSFQETYQSDSTFTIYSLRMVRARLSESFKNQLAQLPDTYAGNEAIFLNFINNWGTHYIETAALGGRMNFRSYLSQQNITYFQGKSVNIGLALTAFAQRVINGTINPINDNLYQEVLNANVVTDIFAYGGDTGTVATYDVWKATVESNPLPINVVLAPYVFLVSDLNVRAALTEALGAYLFGTLSDPTLYPQLNDTIRTFFSTKPFAPADNGFKENDASVMLGSFILGFLALSFFVL